MWKGPLLLAAALAAAGISLERMVPWAQGGGDVVGRGSAALVRVPPGFRVEVYAGGLRKPTAMAFSPRGLLHATQEGGEVVSVRRGSRSQAPVARGFRTPLGLAWAGGRLFVSDKGRITRLGAGGRRTIVRGLPHGLHQQDNLVAGPDGRLYFGNGATCNACRERSRWSGTVLSVRPDGRDLRIEARGLRNAFGLAVQSGTRRLYATENGRDDLGNGEPAEIVVEIRRGRNFGWPACWPSARRKQLVGRCAGVTPPAAYLEPHSSADGLAFYTGRSFPAGYRVDLFVATWGTYFGRKHGREVMRVVLDPGGNGSRARVSTFGTGFEYPLAVAVDPLGALLVADYGRGVIYRIQARGKA